MSFKDDLAADIGTFLNVEEFAELVTLENDLVLPAQIDYKTSEKSTRMTENFSGLMGDFCTIYFASEPYYKKRQKLPRYGEWLYVNDKRYDVIAAQEQKGIIRVDCAAYRQNQLAPRPPY